MVRNNRGFTLLELLIMVAALAIMASFSVSTIIDLVPDLRLKAAAVELYGDLQVAKSNAVMIRERVRVSFDMDGGYEVRSWGADGSWDTSDDTIIKTVTFADFGGGVRLGKGEAPEPKGDSFGSDFITYLGNSTVFDINGMVTKLGYVYLTNDNNKLCYAVGNPTLAGVPKMEKNKGDGWFSE